MALEIIVKSSELEAGRNVARQKLNNPLLKFHEKMKARGSRGKGVMSLEGSIAIDAVETFFGAYDVVKQKLESLPEASVPEYAEALDMYALFVAASYSHTRIGKNVENEKTCSTIRTISNISDEYLLINELATAYLKTAGQTRSAKQLAEATKGYFSAVKAIAKRELTTPKYIEMVKELQKNVQVSFEEGQQEFSALRQKTKKKKKKKSKEKEDNTTFEDVGGNHKAKILLKNIVDSLRHPKRHEYGYEPPRGVFMYGLPGTGKTLIAKAFANECGMDFNYVNLSEVLSKWHGESEQNLRQAMMQEGVIFLDEYDSLGKKRQDHDGTSIKLVNVMAEAMDGYDSNPNALYIAASNSLDVDPKLKRGGRFSEMVPFGAPNEQEMYEILMIHLKLKQQKATQQLFNGVDPRKVAAVLYHKSIQELKASPIAAIVGSDIENIVRKVHDAKWQKFRQTGTFEKISTTDFYPVIQEYSKKDRT